jgi:superfamily II DNA/RNA helicase
MHRYVIRPSNLPLMHVSLQVGALVVSPTRELARQIRDVAHPFVTSVEGLTSALLVGGT